MSKKKSSGKALPIVSIVFFGVSLILFACEAAESIVFRMVTARTGYLHIAIAEGGKFFAFVFPAVFFIVCAGMYLHRSPKYSKLLAAGFAMQALSAGVLLGRLLFVLNKSGFDSIGLITYSLLIGLGLIALLSCIAAILEATGKSSKAVIILIAVCGFAIAVIIGSSYLVPVVKNFALFKMHVAYLLHSVAGGLLYIIAIVFYYTALLMTAFYKKEFLQRPHTVKVVLQSK